MSVAKAYPLFKAYQALAKSPESGGSFPIKEAPAVLSVARNIQALRNVLEPMETSLNQLRNQLMDQQLEEDPNSAELSLLRRQELAQHIRAINVKTVELLLIPIPVASLDLAALRTADGVEALAVLFPYLIED